MIKGKRYIALAIALATIYAIAFIIPVEHNALFWILFSFTNIAAISQIAVWKLSFRKEGGISDVFLGIPIVYYGTLYFALQIIASAIMVITPTKSWVAALISVLLLGAFSLIILSAIAGKETIETISDSSSRRASYWKEISLAVERLCLNESNDEKRTACEELLELIKYSDPVSVDQTEIIEEEILFELKKIENASTYQESLKKINNLVLQRNVICKKNK